MKEKPAWDGDVVLTDDEHAQLLDEARAGHTLTTSYGSPRVCLLPIEANRWALHRLAEMRGIRRSLTGEAPPT